jgi:hypothetical protein
LKTQLYQDLVGGSFGYNNPLPSLKELGNRYAVANKALIKALRALHASGILVPHKKSYLLAHIAPKAKQDTIVLFARASTRDQLARFVPRITEYFYALERVCLAHNIQLQVVRCYPSNSKYVFDEYAHDSFTDAVDIGRVLGFVVWQISIDPAFTLWLTDWVTRFARPVAYYFDIHENNFLLPRSKTALVRCFGVESSFESGRRMGQFLFAKGHRRIACSYNKPGILWQSERLEGLRNAFAEGGAASGVIPRQGEDFDEYAFEINPETSGVFPVLQREQAVRYRPDSVVKVCNTLGEYAVRERLHQALISPMKETVGDRSITAWVGINDGIALECAAFLKNSGIDVPGAVSVIGFDNGFEAASMQMSSYDFNGAGAMCVMVDYLLRPNTSLAGSPSNAPLLLNGFVHERRTTRPAAGGS